MPSISSSICMRRRGHCVTNKCVSSSERCFNSWSWPRTSLFYCHCSVLHESYELNFFSPWVVGRTKAEGELWDIIVEFCLLPCKKQTSFRWFCLLLISVWSFWCVSPKTWVWIPEERAFVSMNNAPFVFKDVDNAVSNLEMVLPAEA